MSANPYDAVPYQSYAYAASHPTRLGVIATLFGLSPAVSSHCRVLEIGCASGGNLLPMAAAAPDARFVGIDYSSVQIDGARAAQGELGLNNIEFRCEDIRAVDAAALGTFDYVIAHGIYSWLPPDAQAAMLALYRDCLAPNGIGYISYNTLPGWRMRGIVRDMMLFHAELFGDDAKKVEQAKALLDFVASALPTEGNPYGAYLRSELQLINSVNDSYLRHDHLEEHNEPLYFRDFMARARANGLEYLGESEFPSMVGSGIAPDALARLKAEVADIVRLEQYMDFLRNRSFRQTLLVKDGTTIQRQVVGNRIRAFHIAANLSPEAADATVEDASPVRFVATSGQTLQTGNPVTKAALACLAKVFPATLAFPELVRLARERLPAAHRSAIGEKQDAEVLANDLLVAFTAPGLVYFHDAALPCVAQAGERPQASAHARWQAARSPLITNLRHETVSLDAPGQLLLADLDGQRDRNALVAVIHAHLEAGRLKVETDGQPTLPALDSPVLPAILDAVLATLGRNALLIG